MSVYEWRDGRDGETMLSSSSSSNSCDQLAKGRQCERASSHSSEVDFMGEGSRGAVEAWGDGAAACNDGESPHCLAYRLCRASFGGFGLGWALLTGGMKGVGGGSGEGARRPDGDMWSPLCMLRYVDAQRRGGSYGLLPARPSSYRSAYG